MSETSVEPKPKHTTYISIEKFRDVLATLKMGIEGVLTSNDVNFSKVTQGDSGIVYSIPATETEKLLGLPNAPSHFYGEKYRGVILYYNREIPITIECHLGADNQIRITDEVKTY